MHLGNPTGKTNPASRWQVWAASVLAAGSWLAPALAIAQSLTVSGSSPGGFLVEPSGMAVVEELHLNDRPKKQVAGAYPRRCFVSLARLSEQLRQGHIDNASPLAGLQRIDGVLVYPQQNDLVLYGRGDAVAMPNDDEPPAHPIGEVNQLPCLTVEDLRSCWMTVTKNRARPFGCSISPSPDGLSAMRRRLGQEPPPSTNELAVALGPQRVDLIALSGQYSISHSIVAADVRLKRLALGVDSSGPFRLPRVQDLGKVMEGVIPRVWVGTEYQPIRRSPDRNTWSLAGEFAVHLDFPNHLEPTASEKRQIVRWCDQWTAAVNDPTCKVAAFHHVRGLSDLAVALALIQRYELLPKPLQHARWAKLSPRDLKPRPVPKSTASLCRIEAAPRRLVAGGVLLSPWQATTLCADTPAENTLWEAGHPPADRSIWHW